MPRSLIPRKVVAAHRYVTRNFRQDPALAEVAAAAGLSRFHVLRQFSRWYGKTPKRLATELRIAEAKRLLLSGMPVGEVYGRLGFRSHVHFSARFKLVVGLSPTAWLLKHQNRPVAGNTGMTPRKRR